MEVQPILEVLVGKTVEQALIEVLEEAELEALREQQRKFLEIRAAETSEAQRLANNEKHIIKEKEKVLNDLEEGVRLQNELEERIAAAGLVQGYIANLLPSILDGLESDGVCIDNIKHGIDEGFMPWLMKEVTHELEDMISSRDILTGIAKSQTKITINHSNFYVYCRYGTRNFGKSCRNLSSLKQRTTFRTRRGRRTNNGRFSTTRTFARTSQQYTKELISNYYYNIYLWGRVIFLYTIINSLKYEL